MAEARTKAPAAETLDRCAHMLAEIAQNSLAMVELARLTVESSEDGDAVSHLSVGIEGLARRVGWMADVAAQQLGGRNVSVTRGDASFWLLPPSCQPQTLED